MWELGGVVWLWSAKDGTPLSSLLAHQDNSPLDKRPTRALRSVVAPSGE